MNRDQIRAEAIERLARVQRAADMAYRAGQADAASEWDDLSERMRDEYRKYVEQFVTALGDLLPTGMETRVDPCDCQPCPECEAAALDQGSERQWRYVTEWQGAGE
ncbi:hypothetical protein ACWDNI_35785 [Nocardia niigatensis]